MTFELPLPATPVLETARLILRPLRLEDAPVIQRHFPQWEVVRNLLAKVPWPYPPDGAETNTRETLAKMAAGEMLVWVIVLKDDARDEAIGRIDLRPDAGDREMRGFWLAREHWGQGLMTEAAEAVTAYAFETLRWPWIWVTNAAANAASHRIKEKQGFELMDVTEGEFVEGRMPREVWRLTREAWLARRGA